MKISLITVVHNGRDTIEDAIKSARDQSYQNTEHIVIDGASTDGTLEYLKENLGDRTLLVSEKDNGIYDALNKGIYRASGEVVGLLHSDDFFTSNNVLEMVADAFTNPTIDAVYGDLQYISKSDTSRIIRYWKAGEFHPAKLVRGWMPPHPTLFLRKEVFEQFGVYDTSYQIAADYDAILRWFGSGKIKAHYIPEVLIQMRVGGESNKSLMKIIRKSQEDYRALRSNKIGGVGSLAWKNASKVQQFVKKS